MTPTRARYFKHPDLPGPVHIAFESVAKKALCGHDLRWLEARSSSLGRDLCENCVVMVRLEYES